MVNKRPQTYLCVNKVSSGVPTLRILSTSVTIAGEIRIVLLWAPNYDKRFAISGNTDLPTVSSKLRSVSALKYINHESCRVTVIKLTRRRQIALVLIVICGKIRLGALPQAAKYGKIYRNWQ